MWDAFRELSLWIEALSIHEWCLFTERVSQNPKSEEIEGLGQPDTGRTAQHIAEQTTARPAARGHIYELLTERPGNRRPLSRERNQVDILILEGHEFVCPWTQRAISKPGDYDLDHLTPISVLPINELWNLVPADARFNSHVKGNRLPSPQRLQQAVPRLALAYGHYQASTLLDRAMRDDVRVRFAGVEAADTAISLALSQALCT